MTKSKRFTLLIAAFVISGCAGLPEAAAAAKANEAATIRNQEDYIAVIEVLTKNLIAMYDKQLQLLAMREMQNINRLDETTRLARMGELLANQDKSRAEFSKRIDAFKARAAGARNFTLAVQMSAAVSRYLGAADETARDVMSILDQVGASLDAPTVVPELNLTGDTP